MKPRAVIFDIDGTVADGRHRQPFIQPESGLNKDKDWKSYKASAHLDPRWDGMHFVYQAVWYARQNSLITSQYDEGSKGYSPRLDILFVSGREQTEEQITKEWLGENQFFDYTDLFMRPKGDYRADDIIKEEILDQHILPHWDVICVFDDRPRVVRMWKSRGLYVLTSDQRMELTDF